MGDGARDWINHRNSSAIAAHVDPRIVRRNCDALGTSKEDTRKNAVCRRIYYKNLGRTRLCHINAAAVWGDGIPGRASPDWYGCYHLVRCIINNVQSKNTRYITPRTVRADTYCAAIGKAILRRHCRTAEIHCDKATASAREIDSPRIQRRACIECIHLAAARSHIKSAAIGNDGLSGDGVTGGKRSEE